MTNMPTIIENARPLIDSIKDERLRDAVNESFSEAQKSVSSIEACFGALPSRRLTQAQMATFFGSWKATHLKMLAIYGLCCRLQRLAFDHKGEQREKLFIAGAKNGETSYEDLGLDADGHTHAELYDILAGSFVNDIPWQLERYCIAEAAEFKNWVYRKMVVDDLARGLMTNMFSEIYNHAEYCLALTSLSEYADKYCEFSWERKRGALRYVSVHVEDNTEVNHFHVVLEALERYNEVIGQAIDYGSAKALFKEYLGKLGAVTRSLHASMQLGSVEFATGGVNLV
jgi:hypothetical protein